MSQVVGLLFLFSLLFLTLEAFHLSCDKDRKHLYKYLSDVAVFQDAQGKPQEFAFTADVTFTCTKKFKRAKSGSLAYLYSMELFNVDFIDKLPDHTKQFNDAAKMKLDYDKFFKGFTSLTISDNGKIYNVFHSKKEEPWAVSIKKSIISHLQSKIHGTSRREKSPEGMLVSHYKHHQDAEGNMYIEKRSDERDIILAPSKHMQPKHTTQNIEVEQKIDKDGNILEVTKTHSFKLEDRKGSDADEEYRRERESVKYEKNMHATSMPNVFEGSGKSDLKFIKIIDTSEGEEEEQKVEKYLRVKDVLTVEQYQSRKSEYQTKRAWKRRDSSKQNNNGALEDDDQQVYPSSSRFASYQDDEEGAQTQSIDPFEEDESVILIPYIIPRFHLHEDIQRSDLLLDNLFYDYMQLERKKQLESSVQFDYELERIRTHDNDLNALAKVAQYIRFHHETALPKLRRKWNQVFQNYFQRKKVSTRNENFLKIGQTLAVACQCEQGQLMLMKTLKRSLKQKEFRRFASELVNHGLYRTLEIEEPIPSIVRFIGNMYKKLFKNGNLDEHSLRHYQNAYLTYSDFASRLPKDHSMTVKILKDIAHHMKEHSFNNTKDAMIHIHAMNNAAKIPLKQLKQIIYNRYIPDEVKLAVLEALVKRNDVEETYELTKLVTQLIHKSNVNPKLKVAAIKAQTDRENTHFFARGTAVRQFGNMYMIQKDRLPADIKHALESYFRTVNTKDGARILSHNGSFQEFEFEEEEVKPLFFKKIGKFFKKVGKKFVDGVKKVGKAVVEGVKKVGKAIGEGVKKIAEIGKKISQGIKKVKDQFKKATFRHNQVCHTVDQSGGKICLYDPDMNAFVSRQGNLSRFRGSKNFSFEKLVGVKCMNLYIGAVGYAGANINCQEYLFDVALFARGQARGHIWGRDFNVVTASFEFVTLEDGNLNDRAYIKIFNSVVMDARFAGGNCAGPNTRNLVHKDFPNLVQFSFVIWIIVPIHIGFSVNGAMGVDLVTEYCFKDMYASVSIEPYVRVGVAAQAGLTIIIAKGGVEVEASFNYRLQPTLALDGCELCALLRHEVIPLTIDCRLFVSFLFKKWDITIFTWSTPPIRGTLFKKCLRAQLNFST